MKNWRLLIWSLGALAIYFFFKYSPLYNHIIKDLEKTEGAYDFGYYILIKITGWFLLLFGTLGILMFLYHLIKKN